MTSGKLLELFIPLIFSLLFTILFYYSTDYKFNSDFAVAISALSGMLLGFTGTILALVTALNSELLKKLRESSFLSHLTILLAENALSALILTIFSLIIIAIGCATHIISSIAFFLCAWCIFSFGRNLLIICILINKDPSTL